MQRWGHAKRDRRKVASSPFGTGASSPLGRTVLWAVPWPSVSLWQQRQAMFSIPAHTPLQEQLHEAKPSQWLLFMDSPTILDLLSGDCFLPVVTLNLKTELQSPPIGTQRNLPLSPKHCCDHQQSLQHRSTYMYMPCESVFLLFP